MNLTFYNTNISYQKICILTPTLTITYLFIYLSITTYLYQSLIYAIFNWARLGMKLEAICVEHDIQ